MAPASSLGWRHDPQRCLGFKPRSVLHFWVCFTFLKQFLTCKTEFAEGRGSFDEESEGRTTEGNPAGVCPNNPSPQEVQLKDSRG